MTVRRTTNYKLPLPESGKTPWHLYYEELARTLDGVIGRIVQITNFQGAWQNSTSYTEGDRLLDTTSGMIYEAETSHVSAASPTTFEDDRTNRPAYWSLYTASTTSIPISSTMQPFVALGSMAAARRMLGTLGSERNSKTTTFTITNEDHGYLLELTHAVNVTFPAPSTLEATNFAVTLYANGFSLVTLSAGWETSFWLYPGQITTVYRVGTNWAATPRSLWKQTINGQSIYVSATGTDSASGYNNSTAPTTLATALGLVSGMDLNGFQFNIYLAAGTYTGVGIRLTQNDVFDGSSRIGYGRGGQLNIIGDTSTPANVTISTTARNAVYVEGNLSYELILSGLKLTTASSGNGIEAAMGARVHFTSCEFGACAGYQLYATNSGEIYADGNFAVSGSATAMAAAQVRGLIRINGATVTYSNSPAYSLATVYADRMSTIIGYSMTFTNGGTVTGTRYGANSLSLIEGDGTANYYPGDMAGSTGTGGQYT